MKKAHPPWVEADLKDLYEQRDAVRRRYKRTRDEGQRAEFKEAFIQNRLFDALDNNKNV